MKAYFFTFPYGIAIFCAGLVVILFILMIAWTFEKAGRDTDIEQDEENQ